MFILNECADLPAGLIKLIVWCFNIIRIAAPIALIIWGMLDFAKAAFASKENDTAKAKKNFLFRVIAAVLVFLTMLITQWVMNIIAVNDSESLAYCVSAIMNKK